MIFSGNHRDLSKYWIRHAHFIDWYKLFLKTSHIQYSWLIDCDGVRLCLRTAATNGPIVHPSGDMWSWRAIVMMMMMPAGDNSWLIWDFRFSRRRVWSLTSYGMQRCIVKLMLTDVSEVRTGSIIRPMSERIAGYIGVQVNMGWPIITCYPFEHGSLIVLMMEAVRTYETSVNINLSTWRYIPEDSNLQLLTRPP
jgi:hypothetical protein